MSSTKSIIRFILLSAFIIGSLIWSASFYIHSSELWSVYISKFTFNSEFANTILLKPLFHFVLSLIHTLPLTDTQHLLTVKILFSLIGLLQVFLILEIFRTLTVPKPRLASFSVLLVLILCFSSINYLQNYFRIRTDQVCITVFLLFIYLNLKNKLSYKFHIFFMILYPMIGFKGLLFSFLHAIHLLINDKNISRKLKDRPYLYTLLIVATAIWTLNLGWNSALYLINTTSSFSSYFKSISLWITSEWMIISICLISLFSTQFQNYSDSKLKINISLVSLISLIMILLFPQKHTYFLASFYPVLVINASAYFAFLFQDLLLTYKKRLFFISTLFTVLIIKLYLVTTHNPYRSNSDQLRLISYLSDLVSLNNLSYLDGIGALPKGNNMNCFVSPDDPISNAGCTELIRSGKPDIVILTSRLMGIIGPNEILEPNYFDSGFNVFIKRGTEYKTPNSKKLQPALFVFGFEI